MLDPQTCKACIVHVKLINSDYFEKGVLILQPAYYGTHKR
jgi:hypothetical protein